MIANRSCPVCHNSEIKFIREINFLLFENHPISKGYKLVQCCCCSFIYADVLVTQKDLDIYYSNISKYEDKQLSTGGGYEYYDKKRLEGVAKYIDDFFPDKGIKIADIGCAIGGLLEQLKGKGFKNLLGIDPSISCVQITKQEKGIDCIHSSLFELDESFGKFDLLVISHVWEHILDLENAIKSLQKILAPNGCIYIECPNAMNYKNTIHAPFQEFNTEHINHFYERGFVNFFGIRNYECLDLGTKVFKMTSGDDYHAVFGIFKKNENLNFKLEFDKNILNSIYDYISQSDNWHKNILNKISNEIKSINKIAFFGIGQYAFKLLFEIKKINPNIEVQLFDNNNLNVGKKINNSLILNGSQISSYFVEDNTKIIITSLIHQSTIKNDICKIFLQKQMKLPVIIELK